MTEPRLVEIRRNVLKQNDLVARALRQRFRDAGIFVVSLVSSPGSGETAFLEKVLTMMHLHHRVAALGNLATDNDASRLARSHAPVKQITTGNFVIWKPPWSRDDLEATAQRSLRQRQDLLSVSWRNPASSSGRK